MKDELVEVRDGLEEILRKVNSSTTDWGDTKNGQSQLRRELRTRLTRLIFYTEGIIDGREDYYKH